MVLGSGILGHLDSGRPGDCQKELSNFLLSRQVENCSPATISTYQKRIQQFIDHANKPIDQIEKSDIELYILSLQKKGLSPHYIESCYRAIRTFFGWLVEEEIITRSPLKNIKRPKTPKFAKEFLTESQYLRLLSVCPSKDYRGIRNRAWLTLLWTTGARFAELANLKLSDLDWQQSRIRVFGKGAKERYVPFTTDAQKAIYRYLAVRPEGYNELWIGEERRPMKHNGLSKVTRTLFERAQVNVKDLHHIFRRTWAYRNLVNGVSPKFVQLIGGWESMSILEQYVKRMDSQDALSNGKVRWC